MSDEKLFTMTFKVTESQRGEIKDRAREADMKLNDWYIAQLFGEKKKSVGTRASRLGSLLASIVVSMQHHLPDEMTPEKEMELFEKTKKEPNTIFEPLYLLRGRDFDGLIAESIANIERKDVNDAPLSITEASEFQIAYYQRLFSANQ